MAVQRTMTASGSNSPFSGRSSGVLHVQKTNANQPDSEQLHEVPEHVMFPEPRTKPDI